MSKADLKLDWCSHEAAKYAVMNWHYSKTMPSGKLTKIGVWENCTFIGCVLFGRGASNNIGKPYGLLQTGCCELVRIALKSHISTVTRIVGISIRLIRSQSPGLRLIVSYADPEQKHSEFRLTGRDSLCPDGASFVSTMPPSPSGVSDGAGSEINQPKLNQGEKSYGRD